MEDAYSALSVEVISRERNQPDSDIECPADTVILEYYDQNWGTYLLV